VFVVPSADMSINHSVYFVDMKKQTQNEKLNNYCDTCCINECV